jgi:phage shock protein C
MYCTQCGSKLDDAARFCSNCGKSTSPDMAPPPMPDGAYSAAYENKRLRRIPEQKKIAGVCAGYAEYFNMDLTLMRLIWVGLLLVPPNIGILAYIVSWVVLPKE